MVAGAVNGHRRRVTLPDPACPSLPIGDYALLSDCHSTALVSRDGSIDWACLRRMDRDPTFARLIDHDRGGYFAVVPRDEIIERGRRYLPHTMVLETTLRTAHGTLRITDAFAMRRGGAHEPRDELLRRLECNGRIEVDIVVVPRFDFGEVTPWLRRDGPGVVTAIGGDDALVIAASVDFEIDHDDGILHGRCVVEADHPIDITALAQPAHRIVPEAASAADVRDHLDETVTWWERWSQRTELDGPHAEAVERSALVLKSLNCAPTGAIIAAPTTSLPEIVGGDSNWDYRYCWIRDATMALDAFSLVGHPEMGQAFRDFIMRSAAGRGAELQVLYTCDGSRRITEVELDLAGWRGSRPVRIGNAAATQVQLDVYGHLLAAAHLWQCHAAADGGEPMNPDEWRFLTSLVERAIDHWQRPDRGIWELRSEPRHYVHSKVMVWVALDRAVRLVEDHDLDGVDLERWKQLRDEIRDTIHRDGLDPTGSHFVQSFGADVVDASLLNLPLVGFIEATDPLMVATVERIRADLEMHPGGLLRRFGDDPTGEPGTGRANDDEGAFLLCSFWLVEVLSLQGRVDEATALFDQLLGYANDLGLLAEQYDVGLGELIGNYPQAFTHLGVIIADARLRAARAAA